MDEQHWVENGICTVRALRIEEDTSKSIVSYVFTIQEKLQKMKEWVTGSLKDAQQAQKQWYDKKACALELDVGDIKYQSIGIFAHRVKEVARSLVRAL